MRTGVENYPLAYADLSGTTLQEVSKQFQIYGDILYAEPTKIGHINETYMATYNQGGTLVRYIHQKINQTVFRSPWR
jgi:hypothetical protein